MSRWDLPYRASLRQKKEAHVAQFRRIDPHPKPAHIADRLHAFRPLRLSTSLTSRPTVPLAATKREYAFG